MFPICRNRALASLKKPEGSAAIAQIGGYKPRLLELDPSRLLILLSCGRRNKARRVAANIAKLPVLLRKPFAQRFEKHASGLALYFKNFLQVLCTVLRAHNKVTVSWHRGGKSIEQHLDPTQVKRLDVVGTAWPWPFRRWGAFFFAS